MPFESRGLQYLLFLLGTIVARSLASETQDTIQFDLVFPKNNTIYEPTYPSPLVFAIHNASALSPHALHWSWNITESSSPTEVIASGMSRADAIVQNMTEQTQLIIEPISALFNNTADLLALRYSFGVTHASDVTSSSGTDVVFEGEVFFKMSRKLPDSEPGDNALLGSRFNCSMPIGAVEMQDLG